MIRHSFLRLGTNCAVFDDQGRVLLSRRGDFDIWNLPGGRLDYGELLSDAAAREVYEETGIRVTITQAVGLYYAVGWGRMTITFAGKPHGGRLRQKTDETRDNRFFTPHELPPDNIHAVTIADALASTRPSPGLIVRTPEELRRMRWGLRRRYVANLLRGRPEPRWARFEVWATGIIWSGSRVLTISNRRMRALPRTLCDGKAAPWQQLAHSARKYCDYEMTFQWVGYWQDVTTDSFEFVFAASVPEDAEASSGATWIAPQNAALNDRDAAYIARTSPDYLTAPVWSLTPHEPEFSRIIV